MVVFIGESGVGKSSLLNSIWQSSRFKAGLSLATITTYEQEYTYEDTLYIDTPGQGGSVSKEKVYQEIQKSFKHNSNYKIIFVATTNTGSMASSTANLINKVCDSIKVPFEYGLVFNRVSNLVKGTYTKEIYKGGEVEISTLLNSLTKRPALVTFLTKDPTVEDQNDVFFASSSPNRATLLKLIAGLKSYKITEKDVFM